MSLYSLEEQGVNRIPARALDYISRDCLSVQKKTNLKIIIFFVLGFYVSSVSLLVYGDMKESKELILPGIFGAMLFISLQPLLSWINFSSITNINSSAEKVLDSEKMSRDNVYFFVTNQSRNRWYFFMKCVLLFVAFHTTKFYIFGLLIVYIGCCKLIINSYFKDSVKVINQYFEEREREREREEQK